MNEIQFIETVKEGDLPRALAAAQANSDLLSAKTPEGLPVVMLAAYYGHAELAGRLFDLGAPGGIYAAAALGRNDVLQELLARQPERVDIPAGDGFRALGLAAFFGHPQSVQLLLQAGADPDLPAANSTRVTALHSACACSSEQAALESSGFLVEAGADPDTRQEGGFTPLHAAAENGYLPVVQLLLANGAEPTPLNDQGRTPGDYARKHGHSEIAALLAGSSS